MRTRSTVPSQSSTVARRVCVWPCAVLCAVLSMGAWGVAPGAAHADIVIPGHKKVKVDVVADLGAWANYSAWSYKVQAGDTLSVIAQKQLGTTRRWKEIEKLNPKVSPERLELGSMLVMPPRKVPRPLAGSVEGLPESAKHWMHFYALPGGGHFGSEMVPLAHNTRVPFHHYGTSLIAVRHDVLPKVLKGLAARGDGTSLGKALESWVGKPGLAVLKGRVGGYDTIDEDSPIKRKEQTIKVTSLDDGVMVVKTVATAARDANDQPVSTLGLFGGTRWILLLLSFAALLALIFVARRRNPADTEQGVSLPTS